MYFKKMELFGFKSFAEKTELMLEPGVTAIVGPNGCGKTNISDAIRWVLGEQSAKQLRGGKMEDVIFNGSRTRQPMGLAEVCLTMDNSQNVLPVDYSEITVTRRLFRSGESEYLLNKVPCRHKDIIELFMDTGVGTDAYSTLENKQIEMILNSKPEDRRFLFEEAAGVMKYKVRKNEALHKLEQTAQNLLRLGDVVSEVKSRISSLDYQARKARQFQKYQEELKTLELNSLYYSWNSLKNDAAGLETLELQFTQGAEKINTEIATCESKVAEIKLALTSLDEQIVAAQQKAFGIDAQVARLEDKVFGSQERKKELEQRLIELSQEKWELEEKYNNLSAERKKISKEKEDLSVKLQDLEKSFQEQNTRYDNNRQTLNEQIKTIDEEKAGYIDLLNKLAQIKNTLTSITSERKNAQGLKDKLNQQITVINSQMGDLNNTTRELTEQCHDHTQSYNQLVEENKKLEGTRKTQQEELALVDKKYEGARNEFNLKNSLLVSLIELKESFAGYEDGVKQILAQRPAGVLGSIPEIIQITNEEYAPLIEMALAEKLQYVLCENEQAVATVIAATRTGESNRITAVALENFQEAYGRTESQPIAGQEGVLGQASAYVKAADRYQSLLGYLLGNTYIVQDQAAAQILMKKYNNIKVITVKGELFTHPAIISVGGKNSGGLLEREIRIKHLQEEKAQLETAVQGLAAEKERLVGLLADSDTRLKTLAGEIQERLLKLGALQKDTEQANLRLKELQQELVILQSEENALAQHLIEHQELMEKVTREYQSSEEEEKQAKIRLAEREQGVVTLNSETAKLQGELTTLKVDLAASKEKSDNMQVLMERFSENEKDLKNEIEKTKAEHASIEKQISELDQARTEVEENITKMLQDKREADQILENMRLQKQDMIIGLRAQETKIDTWKQETEHLQQKQHEQEIKRVHIDTQQEQISKSLNEKYNIAIDNVSLPEILTVPDEEEIIKTRKKIDSLGPVNLVAIDEYEQLQERYNFLLKQQEDMIQAQEDIHKVIGKINQTSREYFESTFKQVQQNFSSLFKQLFEGGEAEMFLTNPDDLLETGVDINVQPPGKKLTNITLLSGGEKALTAIAILFAIFMVKPSPFCVLDEIDAPLDDSNLNRFNRMLLEFSEKTQFIMITHNKKSMEMANVLYGVTMEEFGVSKLVSVKFRSAVAA
ncbi:MAG: chromosome segregation protein SMC [bacterium]|nr:chromosome segregation protein SMC [bacterium]